MAAGADAEVVTTNEASRATGNGLSCYEKYAALQQATPKLCPPCQAKGRSPQFLTAITQGPPAAIPSRNHPRAARPPPCNCKHLLFMSRVSPMWAFTFLPRPTVTQTQSYSPTRDAPGSVTRSETVSVVSKRAQWPRGFPSQAPDGTCVSELAA
jgi:hypothetical protein